MLCRDFENLISEYIDGNLEEDEKIRFERHLFECEMCRNLFKQVEENIELLSEMDFCEEMDSINVDFRSNNIKRSSFKKFVATVAIFLMAFLFFRTIGISFKKSPLYDSVIIDVSQRVVNTVVDIEKYFMDFKNFKDSTLNKVSVAKNDLYTHYNKIFKKN